MDPDEIVLTFPLLMAVLVAVMAQFLVGYNTGVINAPSKVVFPSHTTMEWSLAVSAFAIGGPRNTWYYPLHCGLNNNSVGAMIGGDLANDRGRRGSFYSMFMRDRSEGSSQARSW